ncbi:MAG: maleylacetoacetate isomerase [Pseudomonadota bacterium]|nr:maleylacetoacetate isomerase [Pseudomonadota bacterium]
MTLYSYYRSSAAFRVRIVLNLKGLEYDAIPVDLMRVDNENGEYREVNPQGFVPTLKDIQRLFHQSLAISEYLEETYPESPILPSLARDRAQVRVLSQMVACDIHPLNNLRVQDYLRDKLHASDEVVHEWYRHWIREGFLAIEALLKRSVATGEFCHGDTPTLADACLVPQVYNARRYQCDLSAYPTILRIEANCQALPAFREAVPENQPDAA